MNSSQLQLLHYPTRSLVGSLSCTCEWICKPVVEWTNLQILQLRLKTHWKRHWRCCWCGVQIQLTCSEACC